MYAIDQGAHHVSVAGADPVQRGASIGTSFSWDGKLIDQSILEIDLETFKTMWALSGPEASAEVCFMRLPQYEYHREKTNYDTLGLMPNVSPLRSLRFDD